MPPPPEVVRLARLHRARQQQVSGAAVAAVRRLWPSGPWQDIAAVLLRLMTAFQREAARGATSYVSTSLTLAGEVADPVGVVNESAFAGVAADGRDLASLLSFPAFEVDAFVREGMDRVQAEAIGLRHLERIAQTEIQDAARVATGVAVASDRTVTGYIRMLSPPSCSRCVVLAGKFYRWNAGFERHPQCDCVHIPAAENLAGDVRTDPKAYFADLSEQEQDATFTKAGAQAIRDGADISRVVNARRGLYVAGGRKYTREATTKRGTGMKIRLTPDQIYLEAKGDRDEALRLLKRFGYLL